MGRLEKTDSILIVSFLTLIILPILYTLRNLDDNTLTSWRWVFSDTGIGRVLSFIIVGIVLSFFFSKLSFPERHPAPFLFILSFVTVLPLWEEPEVILDASRYFIQAKYLELYGISYFFREWGREIFAWTDMPVVPFFYGIIFRYLGESRIFIQLFNTLLFSLTAVVTYLLGRFLWDRETGLSAGILLLGIPYLLTQVPLMLVDIPTMFFLTLSIFVFIRSVRGGGILWILLASLSVFLAIFSKFSAVLMLSILPVAAIVCPAQDRRKAILNMCMIMFIVCILSGSLFLIKYDVFRSQIALLSSYQWPGLERWHEGFSSTFLFQSHPFITILALIAVPIAIKKRDWRFLIAGWFAVFILTLHVKRIRYILPLFPLFTLMASYGLHIIADREIKRFIVFCVAASSAVTLFFGFLPFLNRAGAINLRDAGRYLDTLGCETVEVYTLPQKTPIGNTEAAIPILDLFTTKRILYRQGQMLPSQGIETSPLRFTYELKLPRFYYETDNKGGPLIAILSGERPGSFRGDMVNGEQELKLMKEFSASDVFLFRTFVIIAGKGCLSIDEQ